MSTFDNDVISGGLRQSNAFSNAIMSVPRERLLQLMQAQCRVFSNTFNPDGIRTGNKILRQRLRGPALASYYPRRFWTLKGLADTWGPELQMLNEEADDRLEALDRLKMRGKGAPKKKKGPPDAKSKRK